MTHSPRLACLEEASASVHDRPKQQSVRPWAQRLRPLAISRTSTGLPNDINSGLLILAQPPGKKLLYIDSMSGGEKALTALAFLFTIQKFKPSPFYILDEVDAPLDKINTKRVIDMVKKQSKKVQFIIISHNTEMVKAADIVYGVSMEDGESKLIGIKMPEDIKKTGESEALEDVPDAGNN